MSALEGSSGMAQLLDFVVLSDKNKDWHLSFVRELLEYVATEKPSERKYTKWLRERKVFDRKFLAFCERFLDCPREPGKAPVLGEVGTELWEALQKARKKILEEGEAAAKKSAKTSLPPNGPIPGMPPNGPIPQPGRRAPPQPVQQAVNPDDELDEEKAFADKPAPGMGQDPFNRDLLERFVELNGYLGKFVFGEIGEDYLAVSELYRRIGTSAYNGRRPAMPQFEVWVKWTEWLGGIEKIGFRHRATVAGKELGKYLKGIPDPELTVPTKEDELVLEAPPPPAPVAAPSGPVLVANAPTGRRSLEVVEDEDGEAGEGDEETGLASEEGLDLPPVTHAPDPALGGEPPFWANRPHDDAAVARGPLPDPVIPASRATPPPAMPEARAVTLAPAAELAPTPAPIAPPPAPAPPPPAAVAPPPAEMAPPPQAYAPPAPTYAPPAQTHAPPAQAYAPPPQAYAPPPQAYAPPPQAYAPPAPTYAPPPQTYAPPPQAHAPRPEPAPAHPAAAATASAAHARLAPPPPALEPLPAPTTAAPTGSASWARPAVPYSPEGLDPARRTRLSAAAGHVLSWWQAAGRPGERVHAREVGIDLSVYRGPGRGLVVFKLLALGAFLEAPVERAHALAFARELEARRVLETFFVEEPPLEKVLETVGLVDPARSLGPTGEKLVHLLRFRRALKRDGFLARLDTCPNGRELARVLRREVTGDSLATGVVFAIREMARAGHWRQTGIDGLACVPWREVRETAAKLGLLEAASVAGFEDVLAASEALSRFFRESEEGETPLVAYARSVGWTAKREGDLA